LLGSATAFTTRIPCTDGPSKAIHQMGRRLVRDGSIHLLRPIDFNVLPLKGLRRPILAHCPNGQIVRFRIYRGERYQVGIVS